jgi:hypothetical protein
MSVTAVPRSGCFAMRSRGTAVNMPPTARSVVFLAPRRFSPKYIARIIAITTRPNSDGWRLKGPIGIQRCAPICVEPLSSTKTSSTRSPP